MTRIGSIFGRDILIDTDDQRIAHYAQKQLQKLVAAEQQLDRENVKRKLALMVCRRQQEEIDRKLDGMLLWWRE